MEQLFGPLIVILVCLLIIFLLIWLQTRREERFRAAASDAWRNLPCTWATKEELEASDPFVPKNG